MKKLLLFFYIFICFSAHATRVAYTINSKTIVYSDENLEIPIGFIKAGRKIVVSDKDFKANTVTALFVSGRISYVKLKDITFKVNNSDIGLAPEIKEHDVDVLFLTDEDRLRDNNHITLLIAKQALGSDWETFNENYGASEIPTFANQFKLLVEHRSPAKKYGFGLGFSFLSASSTDLKIDIPILYLEYQYRLFQFKLISIEGYGGINFSGGAKLEDSEGQISRGVLLGYELGARARLFPFSKISVLGGIAVSSNKLDSMEPILNDDFEELVLTSIGGAKIEFGVSWKF